jgi:carbon-monoxide dehydrogenase medium subunit
VKPAPFAYRKARTLKEAVALLAKHKDDARLLAGGQSLIATLNMRLSQPALLIDINGIKGLDGIAKKGKFVEIGALARHAEVERSKIVAQHAPLIALAMPHIGHPAIRNRGTFGGSLCNADPASELPAVALAQRAVFNISSSAGDRSIAARDFFVGTYTTALEPNEVLVSVDIPLAGPGSLAYFDELVRRRGDYAMAGLAARADRRDGMLADVQLVFFAVSDSPVVAPSAMALVEGRAAGTVDLDAVCEALGRDVTPLADLTTSSTAKLHLMKVLTRRALAAFAAGEA